MERKDSWMVRCGDAVLSKEGGWTENLKLALLLDRDSAVIVAEELATAYDDVYVAEPV